jgi:hypothetical protein
VAGLVLLALIAAAAIVYDAFSSIRVEVSIDSPEEQTLRAQILYDRSGAGQWPHCGPQLFS